MGILQNYLVFVLANKYFKFFSGNQEIYSWKSKGMSEESIENKTTSENTFALTLVSFYPLSHAKVAGNCLVNNTIPN